MKIKDDIKNLYLNYRDSKITEAYRAAQSLVTHSKERLQTVGDFDLTDEQKKDIDAFFWANYGKKIDYTCHRTYTKFSGGKFDVAYIPEELYIPEIERYMNLFTDYVRVLEDKNVTHFLASSVGIRTPKALFSCSKGLLCDSNYNITNLDNVVSEISQMKEVFCKPTVDSCGGVGCMLLRPNGEIDLISGKKISDIISGLGNDFVVQECIHCHKSIANIYDKSVNTFRVMTYRWKSEIRLAAVIMRVGVGGMLVDNASSGGIFIGIHNDGTLFPFAVNEYGERFNEHPDTKIIFDGYQIDGFDKVLDAAIKAHCAIPQIGIVNWDFTIDEEGNVVLIEANLDFGSPWLFQMVNGCSIFGENTAEILRWVQKMRQTPVSERKNYAFGY